MNPQTQEPAQTPAPTVAASTQSLLHEITDATVKAQMEELLYHTKVAQAMAGSGYWKDTESTPQAIAKIMIGKELGIAPMVSVMNISIQNGRVGFSAELVAALLKRDGYSWRFVEMTPQAVELACYKDGQPIKDENGQHTRVRWTMEHAKRAGLTEPRGTSKEPSVYSKYPEDLLYWRCITRFMRRYAPEVTKGFAGYTPDEMAEIEAADIEAATVAGEVGMAVATRENTKKLKARLAAVAPAAETSETEQQELTA